jgi:hypothetical protein
MIAVAFLYKHKGVTYNPKFSIKGGDNKPGKYEWAPKRFCVTPNKIMQVWGIKEKALPKYTPPCSASLKPINVSFAAKMRRNDRIVRLTIRPSKSRYARVFNKTKQIGAHKRAQKNNKYKKKSTRVNMSSHSHAGRKHSHPLPKQGVHHRHDNGAIGIY